MNLNNGLSTEDIDEFSDIFPEAADVPLRDLATSLRAAAPNGQPHASFRANLRMNLMREADTMTQKTRKLPLNHRGPWAAIGGALALAAVIILTVNLTHGPNPAIQTTANIIATSSIQGSQLVAEKIVPITLSFNQPMNESSVEAGLKITPATAVTTSWTNSTLTITPTHALVAGTPYVISIAQSDLKTITGSVAIAPVTITFTTEAPTPTPNPNQTSTVTVLSTTTTGVVGAHAQLGLDADGIPYAIDGSIAASGVSASPTIGAATPLVLYGSPIATALLPNASTAVISPTGSQVAALVPAQNGVTSLVVVPTSGGTPTILLTESSFGNTLAWSGNSVLFVSGTSLQSISTLGTNPTPTMLATVPSGAPIELASFGEGIYVGSTTVSSPPPAQPGVPQLLQSNTYYTLPSLAPTPLTLAHPNLGISFSASGSAATWVSNTGIMAMSTLAPSPTLVIPTAQITGALSQNPELNISDTGTVLAYTTTTASGEEAVVIPSANVDNVDIVPNLTQPLLDPLGTTIYGVTSSNTNSYSVERASVGSFPTPSWNIPTAAETTLTTFLKAQIGGQSSIITPLLPPSPTTLPNNIQNPSPLQSGTIVDANAPTPSTVVAHLRLVGQASTINPIAAISYETIDLNAINSSWIISNITTDAHGLLSDGPEFMSIAPINGMNTVIALTADGDLTPSSISQALSLTTLTGASVPFFAVYIPPSNTILLIPTVATQGQVVVQVSIALTDFNNVHLAHQITATVDLTS